jgi:hypothetical protein
MAIKVLIISPSFTFMKISRSLNVSKQNHPKDYHSSYFSN